MNLKKKRKPYWSEDPHHTWYELNLEDEILVRGVECNIQ
jgi:predicted transcriptional regulator